MGGSACAAIIIDGNIGYGIVEEFGSKHPSINVFNLEAAVQASCSGILHASLYFHIEEDYSKLTSEYTQPIIDLHSRLHELKTVDKQHAQELVDELTTKLNTATRRTIKLLE